MDNKKEMIKKLDNVEQKYLIVGNGLNNFIVILHKVIHDEKHQLVTVTAIENC